VIARRRSELQKQLRRAGPPDVPRQAAQGRAAPRASEGLRARATRGRQAAARTRPSRAGARPRSSERPQDAFAREPGALGDALRRLVVGRGVQGDAVRVPARAAPTARGAARRAWPHRVHAAHDASQ
jgi:hypothetical protein